MATHEALAHLLEGGYCGVVQLALPVEGGAAVVGQQLPRELGMDGLGKLARLGHVGSGCFHPQHVREWRIRKPAGNGRLQRIGQHLV